MSGLEVAAAVVGISDVAIRSILATYDFLREVQEAPEAIKQVRDETAGVVNAFPGLDFLKTSSVDVQDLVKRVGLVEAVEQCGASCGSLNKDLDKWTKSGDGLVGKLKFVRHKAQVEKCCTQLHRAKGTITLAVSIASLTLLVGSSSASNAEKRSQVTLLEQKITDLQIEAQKQREDSDKVALVLQQRIADNEDDLDADKALTYVKEQKESSEQLWASCIIAEEEIQTLARVDVTVGDMTADKNSSNYAGVPKEVLKKLAQAKVKVGNMKASDGSVNRAGIF
ncbi:hypothetical protein LTR17_020714 [Elasticomyces elasticus]|nr:hypothetical protein LTR17_020714 [Elasticomyces elasticus]